MPQLLRLQELQGESDGGWRVGVGVWGGGGGGTYPPGQRQTRVQRLYESIGGRDSRNPQLNVHSLGPARLSVEMLQRCGRAVHAVQKCRYRQDTIGCLLGGVIRAPAQGHRFSRGSGSSPWRLKVRG